MQVKATREGLLGRLTASGWRITADVPYVGLPSEAALRLWIEVYNPRVIDDATGSFVKRRALVLDVGPWNENDDAYVFGGARPQAESGIDTRGRRTNGAGIDLGEQLWRELRMIDNGPVGWAFL